MKFTIEIEAATLQEALDQLRGTTKGHTPETVDTLEMAAKQLSEQTATAKELKDSHSQTKETIPAPVEVKKEEPPAEVVSEPAITADDVRGLAMQLSNLGRSKEMKEIISANGVTKVSKADSAQLTAIASQFKDLLAAQSA